MRIGRIASIIACVSLLGGRGAGSESAALPAVTVSPSDLDLSRFVDKLQRDHGAFFPNASVAETAIAEYRRFLLLHQRFPEHWLAASKLVDLVWHEHIIDTRVYMADCDRLFGRYLHHTPCFGKGRPFHFQKEMVEAYKTTFGNFPREDIWEIPQQPVEFPGCPTFPPPSPPMPCPAPPPPVSIKLKVSEGSAEEFCIDAGTALGAVPVLQRCNSSRAEAQGFDWFQDMSELSIGDHNFPPTDTGRCVELPDGNTTNGNKLVVECCQDRTNSSYTFQKFGTNSAGQIEYQGGTDGDSKKCIAAKSKEGGAALIIMDCQDVDLQKWDGVWPQLRPVIFS